jgi:putative redox protein
MYADRKGWPLETVTVRLGHQKVHAGDCAECETKDGRIDRIGLDIELEGPLDEPQRRRLLEIAERCPVHRTLESEVMIETSLVGTEDRVPATSRNGKVICA